MSDLEDHRLSVLREKLNSDKIKLWLPPYTVEEDRSSGHYPTELLTRYSEELNTTPEVTSSLLETLRIHALENLALRNKFQNTGVATLKVKLIGDHSKIDSTVHVETGLHILGKDLKALIENKADLKNTSLKLISRGKVILENKSLQEQNIKHNSQVMALAISGNAAKTFAAEEQQCSHLQRTREDAELLAASADDDNVSSEPYLQVADQSGRVLKLPPEEQKALALAMTFHEKGRAAIKRKDYSEALIFLLESDNEFRKCTADILTYVDNYALLCLDITWCYLQLRSISHLPDAAERLDICENGFKRSYGQNLERLELLKKGIGKEASLLARLHLLQGVLAFYKNRREESRNLLMKAQNEIKSLKVDDGKLSQIMSLGYTATEGRLALRQSKGDVELAVSHIIQHREELKQIREKEEEERKMRKKQRKLGKTENGEWVHVENYKCLLSMGFPKSLALAAIRHANNNISLAIQIMHEQPQLLQLPDTTEYFSDSDINDEDVALLSSHGFEMDMVKSALKETKGDQEQALNRLMSGEVFPGPSNQPSPDSLLEKQKRREAVQRLAADIEEITEGHLDLILEEEENILNEYLSLLDTSPA